MGLERQDLVGAGGGRDNVDLEAPVSQAPENVLFDTEVHHDHALSLSGRSSGGFPMVGIRAFPPGAAGFFPAIAFFLGDFFDEVPTFKTGRFIGFFNEAFWI